MTDIFTTLAIIEPAVLVPPDDNSPRFSKEKETPYSLLDAVALPAVTAEECDDEKEVQEPSQTAATRRVNGNDGGNKTKKHRGRRVHSAVSDSKILAFVNENGKCWRMLARILGRGWSDDVVRNRWARLVGEQVGSPRPKDGCGGRSGWTAVEDATLRRFLMKDFTTGRKWVTISAALPGRTPHACRNRLFRLLEN